MGFEHLQQSPLAGIDVVELGEAVAVRYCGRLFAQLGANVVRVSDGDSVESLVLSPLSCFHWSGIPSCCDSVHGLPEAIDGALNCPVKKFPDPPALY